MCQGPGWAVGTREVAAQGCGFLRVRVRSCELNCGAGRTSGKGPKRHRIRRFKWVHLVVFEQYHDKAIKKEQKPKPSRCGGWLVTCRHLPWGSGKGLGRKMPQASPGVW